MDFGSLGLTAVIGLVMVPLVSFLKKEHWNTKVKFLLAVLACGVDAGITTAVNNHVHSVAQFVALWAAALATTQAVYRMYFADTGWEKSLNA